MQGLLAAVAGVVSDPVAGWHSHHLIGVLFGVLKAAVGLGLRPMAGITECLSKGMQGCALVCLGRQGIQGRITRRVYAPAISPRLHDQREVCLSCRRCFPCFVAVVLSTLLPPAVSGAAHGCMWSFRIFPCFHCMWATGLSMSRYKSAVCRVSSRTLRPDKPVLVTVNSPNVQQW